MAKYLIIHADDFGMCYSVNLATIQAFACGKVTSASFMAPCSWFPNAANWARFHPEYDFGVHLTFTSEWENYKWRPLINNYSFTDKHGYIVSTEAEFAARASVREVELETCAQIEAVLNAGIKPTHVDSHMFTAYSRPDIRNICEEVAARYKLYFRKIPTAIAGVDVSEDNWVQHYEELISMCPEGISQLIVHPGVNFSELLVITSGKNQGNAESRQRDINVLLSKEFEDALKRYDIKIISWKDVKDLQCI